MEYLPPPSEGEPSPPSVNAPAPAPAAADGAAPRRGPNLRGLGAIGAAILAFFLKFKLLIFVILKGLAPAWTFILSLWIYLALFGWKLAVVLMLVLLAHELGHYFAFRAYGLPVRLPSFIPLLGAFTAGAPPENLEHDAYIALAGPLTGLGLAAVCYALGLQTHEQFWYACAYVTAFLNLFNMIPVPPFDGGRIVGAIWPLLWFGGFVAFLGLAFVMHLPLLFVLIIGVVGLPQMLAAFRGQVDPRAAAMTNGARLRVSLWYLGTLLCLFYIMGQAHVAASTAAGTGSGGFL